MQLHKYIQLSAVTNGLNPLSQTYRLFLYPIPVLVRNATSTKLTSFIPVGFDSSENNKIFFF